MAFGNIGKVLVGQALETTKKSVLDGLLSPETAKSVEKIQAITPPAQAPGDPIGVVILNQLQAMQRALREDQELVVLFTAGAETLRVLEIFVPTLQVFVLVGVDADQNVTRVVIPAEAAQLVCKIMKVAAGSQAVRVSVRWPRPKEQPGA
jgi:hypothetical protein